MVGFSLESTLITGEQLFGANRIFDPNCDDYVSLDTSPANLFCLNTKTGRLYITEAIQQKGFFNGSLTIGTTYNVSIEIVDFQFPYHSRKGSFSMIVADVCNSSAGFRNISRSCDTNTLFHTYILNKNFILEGSLSRSKLILGFSILSSVIPIDGANYTTIVKYITDAETSTEEIVPIERSHLISTEVIWNYYIKTENKLKFRFQRNGQPFNISFSTISVIGLISWANCDRPNCLASFPNFYSVYERGMQVYPQKCFRDHIKYVKHVYKVCKGRLVTEHKSYNEPIIISQVESRQHVYTIFRALYERHTNIGFRSCVHLLVIEVYLGLYQTSIMEFFAKIYNGFDHIYILCRLESLNLYAAFTTGFF